MAVTDGKVVKKILLEAGTASAAIKAFYEYYKLLNPKLSLAWFCGRAGIKSKGYLADVISGRRVLNQKYAEPLAAAFGLKGHAARAFKIMVEIESGELDTEGLVKAEERLVTLRRSLDVDRGDPLPTELARMAMAFEVYCSFGLYGNAPEKADLVRYFGERHAAELDAALALLARHELIEEHEGRFRATKNAVVFGASGACFDHIDYLRSSLRDAERALKAWFPKRDEAYIESVILSVRKEDYLRMLPLLRERILETRSRLDTEDADMLVRFNVQVYPVRGDRT